jgi:hypothetical protein
LIENALDQVKNNCNEDVYQTIKKACDNYNRVLDFEAVSKQM